MERQEAFIKDKCRGEMNRERQSQGESQGKTARTKNTEKSIGDKVNQGKAGKQKERKRREGGEMRRLGDGRRKNP